jgi:hypothetical protein
MNDDHIIALAAAILLSGAEDYALTSEQAVSKAGNLLVLARKWAVEHGHPLGRG